MRSLLVVCVVGLFTARLSAQEFDRAVAPLLISRCLECHSGLGPKGKLDLTTRANALKGGKSGPAIVPGKLDESELWLRVDAGQMPPKKPLSESEKQVLRRWIAEGASWGSEPLDLFSISTDRRAGFDWWSLKPVRRPESPNATSTGWARTPIDWFIFKKLEEKGLKPAPEADRRTLIRRVTFDLLGLPPTPEQIERFVRDPRPDAYEKLVDELLESRHLGERWARHWLDIVRFGESHGFEHDELRKNAWPYRDWLIEAFNKDLPYDEFVRQQIAGDVLHPNDAGALTATGFLVAGGYDSVGQRQQSAAMKAVVRQDELEDMISTLGQTFLGLTVHCARCHDHKFDPIRQVEYYRLSAALAGVRHGERDLPRTAPDAKRLAAAQAELEQLEDTVRKQVLAERSKTAGAKVEPSIKPLARWDFTASLDDQVGTLHAKLHGAAQRTAAGLATGTDGYAATPPLVRDIKSRTLSVWVKLNDLEQRGGAAISLQKLDGSTFDAIVLGEKEPRKWLAGSDFFRRSLVFGGPPESAVMQPVHLAWVYRNDGAILAYRNGQQYGTTIRPPGPVTYAAGQAQILFGLRHTPAGGNKHLAGVITRAELYDRPLSAAEVAALAGSSASFVSEEMLLGRMSPEDRKRRAQLLQEIAASEPRASGKVYAVTPQTPEATFVLLRGEPARKAEQVTAGGVQAVHRADFGLEMTAGDAERRRKLAEWITAPANPLLARVFVNRLWHYHFGVGIVETPSDFGFSGGRPSHPELLDWLADEFRRQGWSIKKLHRLIVTSAVYRQQSRWQADAAAVDAGNRLLWRKSPMRLEAEAVRDAVLSVSGKLNPAMYGPGYQDFKISIRGATHYYVPQESDAADMLRRSVYRTWVRSGRNPLLDVLDCPDPSTVTPRRTVTTTPLQALTLLNGELMLRMADHFAQRVERDAGTDRDQQIQRAYELAFGRTPDAAELASARRAVAEHGLGVLCRAIVNSSEFIYVD